MLGLAGCQSSMFFGDVDGASTSGTTYLTSIRSSHGLSPLSPDPELEKAAERQARFMARAGKMTHATGLGRDFAARMSRTEINGAAAENIAHGGMSMEKLFDMWMDSEGHRKNMLDPSFTRFGLASAGEGRDKYWALVLGR
jgi:uncharacterized protein YkwD